MRKKLIELTINMKQKCHRRNMINKAMLLTIIVVSFNASAQFGGPTPVKAANVQELMMSPIRKIPATVEAKFVATIKTESKGILSDLAEVGSTILKGETIATLKDSQVKLRLEEFNGAVKSSEAKLTFLESENSRLNDLVKKNLVSNSELEQNKSNFISAKNDLVQAKARLKQFLDTVEKLEIKAPYEGIVMQHLSQPGQLLSISDNVIEFMQANNLEVIVNVPFKYKSQIKTNTMWQVESSDKQVFDATIKRFVPAATGQSHTIEVYLSLLNANLWSGEAINVLVPTQMRKKVIAVPRDALVIRKNGTYVYTIVENKSHKVDVITGMAQGELIEVKGLLSAGDLVIVRGNERIGNEQDVNVLN